MQDSRFGFSYAWFTFLSPKNFHTQLTSNFSHLKKTSQLCFSLSMNCALPVTCFELPNLNNRASREELFVSITHIEKNENQMGERAIFLQ